MTKFYRIKEFSDLTKVTVRTLHYYDEIGLLKPTGKTASGHRLYSEDDLLRLQQISTLKFMGFSLRIVKNIILNLNFDIENSLIIQAKMLQSESQRLKQAAKLIQYLIVTLKTKKQVDWKIVTKIIEVMQMSQTERNKWEKTYLHPEELSDFEKLVSSRSKEEWEEYHQKWISLLNEIEKNLNKDPGSDIGQQLAKEWMSLVENIYGNYPQLKEKMWEALKADIMPKNNFPYNQEVIAYMIKATDILKKKK